METYVSQRSFIDTRNSGWSLEQIPRVVIGWDIQGNDYLAFCFSDGIDGLDGALLIVIGKK
jgi:hypothetical protein